MKKIQSDIVNEAKNMVQDIVPKAKDVRVQSMFIPPNTYKSKVLVNLKRKTILAEKRASSLRGSLNNCLKAIERQVEKYGPKKRFVSKESLFA